MVWILQKGQISVLEQLTRRESSQRQGVLIPESISDLDIVELTSDDAWESRSYSGSRKLVLRQSSRKDVNIFWVSFN